jgi:hypothetical protein
MTAQQLLIAAIRKAGHIIAEHHLEAARICSSCKRQEKIVPALLLWAVPARIFVGSTASYFVAMVEIMDSTLAIVLAESTATPRDRRRKFKVIEGGKR